MKARRAKFSGGRFVVESLGSGLIGSLVSFGTYRAACGDTPCLGGAIGGLVVDIAVTPLAAYGIGQVMGGNGNLGSTYVVGLAAFAGGGAATANDAILVLAIGMIIEPFAAALGYEISSSVNAHKVLGPAGWIRPNVTPIAGDKDTLRGASLGVTAHF